MPTQFTYNSQPRIAIPTWFAHLLVNPHRIAGIGHIEAKVLAGDTELDGLVVFSTREKAQRYLASVHGLGPNESQPMWLPYKRFGGILLHIREDNPWVKNKPRVLVVDPENETPLQPLTCISLPKAVITIFRDGPQSDSDEIWIDSFELLTKSFSFKVHSVPLSGVVVTRMPVKDIQEAVDLKQLE